MKKKNNSASAVPTMRESFSKYCSKLIVVPGDTIRANIYLFKVSDENPRNRCELCSKLRIETSE